MNEKIKGHCDRCGLPHNNRTIMSKFNTEEICIPCKDKEVLHPEYKRASEAEIAEVKKGNYNFQGIGLPSDLK